MRKLSLWAKHYPVYARIVIVVSHCFLIVIAYFLGTLLSASDINLSPLWIYFFISIFFMTAALYPSKSSSKNFIKRKFCDCLVACCGFALTVCLVNDLNKPFTFYQTAEAVIPGDPSPYKYAEAGKLLEQFKNGEKTKFNVKEKRIIKKEFKYQVFQYAKAKITGDKKGQYQAGTIILVCIAAVGLLILVGSIACSLSCNGSEAAAWVVFILGATAIVWGAIALIRSIKRKHAATKSGASP